MTSSEMYRKKVDLIADMQYGSTGKGKVAGRLAIENQYDVVVGANMPNAGHTYVNTGGNHFVHKVLPNGVVSERLKYCLLGSGSVFSIEQLRHEIDRSCKFIDRTPSEFLSMLRIHENSVVLTEEHQKSEKNYDRIGSTQQGSAAAMITKLHRDPNKKVIARDVLVKTEFEECLINNSDYLNILLSAQRVLAEGAQGFSLGISQPFYPYCTSRDCTPERLLADMNIPLYLLKDVIGVIRTYPIRVGGKSGGYYPDQREIDWETLGVEPEVTTVTRRVRRVFTFSDEQFAEAAQSLLPDYLHINFTDYLTIDKLHKLQSGLIEVLQKIKYPKDIQVYYGTGAGHNDIIKPTKFIGYWKF